MPVESQKQTAVAEDFAAASPYDNHSSFPEAEDGSAYYEYADDRVPLMAVTKASEVKRWTRNGLIAVAGFGTVATVGGLLSEAVWWTPAAVPLATYWEARDGRALSVDSFADDVWDSLFKEFFERFHRINEYTTYSPEYFKRLETFKMNTITIAKHNQEARAGLHDVTLAPNQFMDMDWSEFRNRHLSPPTFGEDWTSQDLTSRIDGGRLLSGVANQTIPDNVNWVKKGCVTPVKNQAHCGSCWAFSSTGALEGAYCAQSNKTISLSEQQLVDCARPEGNQGCHGGFMSNAFQYVIDNRGLCSEDAYPYEGVDTDQCRAKSCESVVKVKGIMELPAHDEKAVRAALALYGPVSVAIEADRPVFQFYHKGVMSLKCGKQLNHAVLAVGYGTEEATGEHYWLIKNSWGETWGDVGYIKLTRDKRHKNGECGVLLAPVLPVLDL